MKKLLLLFALFAVALSATASPTERWLDPECFAENRAPMHTSFIVFPTASEAVPENDYTRSPFYRTLNGEWAFLRAERPGAEPEGFFRTGYDDSSWGVMPVPGIWELNGYGDPVYTNKPYPWYKFFEVKPPLVPHEQNYTGLYRRTVHIPADWKGRDAFIHIGSATSNVTLWVNGREVGYSEDSKLEAEFDVTRYITPGRDNLIVLRVNRWCDGSYLEDQDFWRLSGIGRDCYLYTRDKRRLADVRLTPDLVNDYRDGTLRAEVTATPGVGSVRLTLRDDEGRTLDTRTLRPRRNSAETLFEVAAPKQWSAEAPNLYTLTAEALAADGSVTEAAAFRVGFRKVEIRGGQLLVNGKPILIKGVNRHEMEPNTGYYVTRGEMVRDIRAWCSETTTTPRSSYGARATKPETAPTSNAATTGSSLSIRHARCSTSRPLTTGTTTPTSSARCIGATTNARNTSPTIPRNRLSNANTLTPWAIRWADSRSIGT